MRKIFQFDGIDQAVLSIGECKEPERVAICIKDSEGHEVHMLLGQENFRELCSLSYDIRWMPAPCQQEEDEELPL
ncbi:MAG: hypothetical protein R3F44_19545 [Candidatus Competibacteraceae bacterium]